MVARGRRRVGRLRELGLFLVRREIAAVVGRPLLVAERLEAILQILLEVLKSFFIRSASSAASSPPPITSCAENTNGSSFAGLASMLEYRVPRLNQPRRPPPPP
jgi:hypothetical protein